MLEQELKFFESRQQELIKSFPAKFVLIKGENLEGVFESFEDAVLTGRKRFGNEPFLVRRTDETTQTVNIPALSMGILRADSDRSFPR
jgi:hypothetical protein